jgi:general stress protein YciG
MASNGTSLRLPSVPAPASLDALYANVACSFGVSVHSHGRRLSSRTLQSNRLQLVSIQSGVWAYRFEFSPAPHSQRQCEGDTHETIKSDFLWKFTRNTQRRKQIAQPQSRKGKVMSDKPRMSAAEAGRKGGQSRSAKKLAAIRKNGFQPMPKPTEPACHLLAAEPPAAERAENGRTLPVLVVPRA